jgi:hypothetical protein
VPHDHSSASWRLRHAKRSVLLDWVNYSRGHSDWFQPDHLHLTFAGAAGFARLLGKATRFAKPGKFPCTCRVEISGDRAGNKTAVWVI